MDNPVGQGPASRIEHENEIAIEVFKNNREWTLLDFEFRNVLNGKDW